MVRISTLRSAHELDSLRSRWQALAAHSPLATIFQHFEWNRLAAQVFAEREAPWVIHAISDSGEAIIPAVRRKDEIGLLGETLFDYRNVLAVGAPEVVEAAFYRLAELRLPFRVTAVRGDAAEWWPEWSLVPFAGAPCVHSSQTTAESFRRSQSRLASRARRLPRKGINLHRNDNPSAALVRDLYERKSLQPEAGDLFTDPLRRDFMRYIVGELGTHCTIWCYENANRQIATLLTLRNGCVRHFYTTWYDPEFADLSPGQALLFEATAQTLAEGLDADFMTGESLYKNRLATDNVPLFRVDAPAERVAQLASARFVAIRQPSAA